MTVNEEQGKYAVASMDFNKDGKISYIGMPFVLPNDTLDLPQQVILHTISPMHQNWLT